MQTWSITLHGPLGVISTVDTGESQFVIGTETASDVFTVHGEGVAGRHAWAPVLNSPTPNPAAKKKAVVAIARQLAVDLWRVFTGQVEAEKFGLVYLPEAA